MRRWEGGRRGGGRRDGKVGLYCTVAADIQGAQYVF